MKNLKPITLIGISLLALSSVVCINTLVTPVSAATIHTADYVWLGGYLNVTLTMVNISDPENPSIFARTTSNGSLDYWEDHENWTLTDDTPYNVICPKNDYLPTSAPLYSKDLSEDLGLDLWYEIRLQWRPAEGNGYGKYYSTAGTGDVDYHMFCTGTKATGETKKYGVKSDSSVVEVDTAGNWIGSDGTSDDPARSMWARQMLFINATFYLGGKPPNHLLAVPVVQVPMDSWLTTGSAYCNVTYPGHPLDGVEVSGEGLEWDSNYDSAVFMSCGAEINQYAEYEDPMTHDITPMNVSYIFGHKHLVGRSDLLLPGDATMDGYANVLDLGRMSDYWLWDSTSKEYGTMIGNLEKAGNWGEVYKIMKEVNSLDFNGDEFVNVVDLGILSDHWLESGWSPPTPM